ncbi:MAG: hypothetical protein EXR84_03835 [Gammaproteobacteria bacterium]|nr:hypothetical protein [Gammaproteobacteria bacterium]
MKIKIVAAIGVFLLFAGALVIGQHLNQHQQLSDHGLIIVHANPQQTESAVASDEDAPVTVSIRQEDFDLCTQEFYVGIYELAKEVFANGADNVTAEYFQERTFAYFRSREYFSAEAAEGWVEHAKDIPGQLLTIIREDPAVLDTCANFSIALVGPP